ncbi:hypothetical protein XENTR_v10005689 [Xenopus tropicalis]|nr:hypothetical protein XENTR_v10005689 [Xenopus tropicalis]
MSNGGMPTHPEVVQLVIECTFMVWVIFPILMYFCVIVMHVLYYCSDYILASILRGNPSVSSFVRQHNLHVL